MLAVFTVGIWVLAVIARPLNAAKIVLIAAMASGLVLLLAVPDSRRIFALRLPPGNVLAVQAAVVIAAIVTLTVWRQIQRNKTSSRD
jgi:cation-transporting ATPase E